MPPGHCCGAIRCLGLFRLPQFPAFIGNICQNWRGCGVPCPYKTCGPRTGRPGASKQEDGELPMSAMPARMVLAIVSILAIAVGALAEEAYPARPITMVVTFAAGGSSDVLARAAAESMSHGLGQQIAVDNRPFDRSSTSLIKPSKCLPLLSSLLSTPIVSMAMTAPKPRSMSSLRRTSDPFAVHHRPAADSTRVSRSRSRMLRRTRNTMSRLQEVAAVGRCLVFRCCAKGCLSVFYF